MCNADYQEFHLPSQFHPAWEPNIQKKETGTEGKIERFKIKSLTLWVWNMACAAANISAIQQEKYEISIFKVECVSDATIIVKSNP